MSLLRHLRSTLSDSEWLGDLGKRGVGENRVADVLNLGGFSATRPSLLFLAPLACFRFTNVPCTPFRLRTVLCSSFSPPSALTLHPSPATPASSLATRFATSPRRLLPRPTARLTLPFPRSSFLAHANPTLTLTRIARSPRSPTLRFKDGTPSPANGPTTSTSSPSSPSSC